MGRGIPPRYDTDCEDGYVALNGECVKRFNVDTYVDKNGMVVFINHTNLHPSEIIEGNTWLDSDLVPAIMADPIYYLKGKWKKGTNCSGPK